MKIKVTPLVGIKPFISIPGEQPLVVLRPSWLYYIRYLIVPIGMTLFSGGQKIEMALLYFGVCFFLFVLSMYSNLYIITSHRVIEKRGLIARHTSEAFFSNIQMIKAEQGIVDRFFGTGKIKIESAGQNGRIGDVVFGGIRDPLRVKELIFRMQNRTNINIGGTPQP